MTTTDIDLFSRKGEMRTTDERARAAVSAFRRLQPTLSSYARVLTGGKHTKVEMSVKDNGSTDGKTIYYRPPLALGDNPDHNRSVCGNRDGFKQLVCPACKVREEILVTIYHEIAHISQKSFTQPDNYDIMRTIEKTVKTHGSAIAKHVESRIEGAPVWKKKDYINLASLVSPYFPMMVNCLEDARVNSEMFRSRPGTKKMFDASMYQIFTEGVEQASGEVIKWVDYPINAQMMVGCFVKVSGYEFSTWFHPQVVEDLADEALCAILTRANTARSAKAIYEVSFDAYVRLRELGYCQTPDDMEPESGPDGTPDDQADEETDSDEASSSSGEDGAESDEPSESGASGPGESGLAPPEREDHNESEEASESSDGGEGDGSSDDRDEAGGSGDDRDSDSDLREPEQNDNGEYSSTEASDREGDQAEDDESGGDLGRSDDTGDASASGERSGETDKDSDAGSPLGGDGDSPPTGPERREAPEEGEASDDLGEGVPPEQDDSGLGIPDGSKGSPQRPEGDLPGDEGSPDDSGVLVSGSDSEFRDNDSDSDVGGVDDQAEDKDDRGAPESGPGTDSNSDGDADDSPELGSDFEPEGSGNPEDYDSGEQSPETSGHGDSAPMGEKIEGDEPIDTGADTGEGGATVLDNGRDDEADLPEFGTPEEVEAYLQKIGHHEHATMEEKQKRAEEDKKLEIAIVQGMYFEMPSSHILGVREHFYGKPIIVTDAWGNERNFSDSWNPSSDLARIDLSAVGIEGDFYPAESIMGSALLRMRRVFEDNARGGLTRNQKSGRVDAKVLGKRAFHNDERLFRKKVKPGKRDYHVLIGLDVSGSTVGRNLILTKRSAMAQAQLCHRLGVSFSVYAHSGNIDIGGYGSGLWLEIYHVKDPTEPWSDAIQNRLTSLGPSAANLDGHTLEYYRKRMEEVRATDKIIMYYTDGKMPAENFDEELEILQRELRTCKSKNINLMGVGIRTDSPVRHGLDTVQVDSDEDIIKVVNHLEKVLR